MKARILTSILAVVFSVAILNAANPNSVKYTNEETTAAGTVKEYTFCEKETLKPLNRAVYQYNANGELLEKVYYKWDNNTGWVSVQKYNYEYQDNKVASLIYSEWDSSLGTWSENPEYITYVYNKNGELLTLQDIIENSIEPMATF